MFRRAVPICVFALAACGSHAVSVPPNVTFGAARALPRPLDAANGAPPRILAMHFSAASVRRGQTWSGTVITSTNVASVEVRSNLFSLDLPRRSYGDFRFSLRVFDVPPIFIRAYRLRVIARNSAGHRTEEDVPFRIR